MTEKVARVNRMTEFEDELTQLIESVQTLRMKVWKIRTTTSIQMSKEPYASQCGYPTDDGVDYHAIGEDYGDSLSWTDTLDDVKKSLDYLQTRQKRGK